MSLAQARQLAQMVREARRVAVLTGAGVSTASGIPDFRSANGFYSDERNANAFDIDEFNRDPRFYYRFAREFYDVVAKAQPNVVHRALAAWEEAGRWVRISTQNIDDLHQRAGSRHVYPVHGTVESSTCQDCARRVKTVSLEETIRAGQVPLCACGGVFKPDITFFGEMLPEDAWDKSVQAMSQADLVLVLGTSLVVFPAASLPGYRPDGARLVIVNRDPTPEDAEADLVCRDDLSPLLEQVAP